MNSGEHHLNSIMELISSEMNGAAACAQSHTVTSTRNSYQLPYIKIIVQPRKKSIRFRYASESRTAGSIPGHAESKSPPAIEIVGFSGEARVIVSCVTKDEPYRPHPHKLIGQDCKDGVCIKHLRGGKPLRCEFNGVGIRCARRQDVAESLNERAVDPFKTGFVHPTPPDLNRVRLCFQAEVLMPNNRWESLTPVVSNILYDRKANEDLEIVRLCSCSATVEGGDEIILLCQKVVKKNIRVRFKALVNDVEVWHAYGDFEPETNVHHQTAIAFKTPRYPKSEFPEHAKTFIELERPNDGAVSEALEFEFHYGPDFLKRKRRKTNAQILAKYGELANIAKQMYPNVASQNNTLNIPNQFSPTTNMDMKPPISPNNYNLSPGPSQQQQQQQFTTYRNNFEAVSPSPLSPQSCYTSPSPNRAYAMSPLNNNNKLQQDLVYTPLNGGGDNIAQEQSNNWYHTYNEGITNVNFNNFTQTNNFDPSPPKADFVVNHMNIAPVTSGGCFTPLTHNNFASNMPTMQNLNVANNLQGGVVGDAHGDGDNQHNQLSESAAIERIILDFLQSNQITDNA